MSKPEPADSPRAPDLFGELAPSPEAHFKLHFFGALLGFLEQVSEYHGSFEAAVQQFPFLAGYHNELAGCVAGLSSAEALARWWPTLAHWEAATGIPLPLRLLRQAMNVEPQALAWLMTVGLTEEDGRFGPVFDFLQGGAGVRRPTLGFLRHCWQQFNPAADIADWFARFREAGLVRVLNPDTSRTDWVLQVPVVLWDALRGLPFAPGDDGMRFRLPADLPRLDDLILGAEARQKADALPRLLASGDARAIVVRGPPHNGRHALLQAVARELGLGVIEFRGQAGPDAERWRLAGALALLRKAMVVVEYESAPGETITLPECVLAGVPVGVVLGRQTSVSGGLAVSAMSLELGLPELEARRRLWLRCPSAQSGAAQFSENFRMASGLIRQVAETARAQAALGGRDRLELADVQQAARGLGRHALEPLARCVPVAGELNRLCAGERTWRELEHLERRCRHRERLPIVFRDTPDGARNCGVRALFHGPSGTGKTLAARLLAGSLHKDLYQLDLSAVMNKYIGETEKNLNRAFDLAEELDVILLLDEGDALLTRRTDVQSANDRYANLETNFLLQRLESFEGIVIITTNTRDRIDHAFERRMDVAVEFLAPDAAERWQLWQNHLPAERRVDEQWLSELAGSCELTGGQIRNAALHAALLALDNGGAVTTGYLEAAVRREYARQGAVCPLRWNSGELADC